MNEKLFMNCDEVSKLLTQYAEQVFVFLAALSSAARKFILQVWEKALIFSRSSDCVGFVWSQIESKVKKE